VHIPSTNLVTINGTVTMEKKASRESSKHLLTVIRDILRAT